MKKRKIILDCDPGHDDAIAIMLAARHPAIDLLGITIVAGNQTLNKTLVNGLNVCQKLDINVPIHAGMPKPIMREQIVADNIHGESGLDGPIFAPLVRKAESKHAIQYIIDTLMNSDGDITLVPVGPLTNIAVAMRMQPAILPKIREIVLMGGAYGTGNFTPSAEFNIYADPEAARVVFTSGVPLVMMGLDLTNQTTCTADVISRMKKVGGPAGELFSDIMSFTLKTQYENYGLAGGPVHDATCIGYLINPDAFKMQDMYVEIDVNNGPCYGRTVCDELGVTGKQPNTKVGMTIDTKWFWDLVEECVRMYI
ncbi:ribosylpyrimidine nucleosidase [Obesumbacterium proteus]|uniref:ribosylpyrimidine nucleosidase n=1 Tax=Obesumbacterium proteus TaxID=82983 RepID=UPI00103475CE|nr:ribosylpyrimidine nucleosidase [Obesumbacterium proteus]MCE9884309.1 ribosylpyrimidine nucleosidase [Obesumbacterium proteus]MCE9916886.1 ribosylpyrimidine nucleosidase [Obesumbacterium proteus]MCE9931932.1 ribosylpyrimidine nucleosidase [Obesumbacterium proteus]MCG2879246.1 ribosylpyrimidine nucleosidase [Obesumbacterium proteus]TBL53565.1 ribosylpyrimidine nucleosidase [Obesumbacterium proteus]